MAACCSWLAVAIKPSCAAVGACVSQCGWIYFAYTRKVPMLARMSKLAKRDANDKYREERTVVVKHDGEEV